MLPYIQPPDTDEDIKTFCFLIFFFHFPFLYYIFSKTLSEKAGSIALILCLFTDLLFLTLTQYISVKTKKKKKAEKEVKETT